MRRSLLITLLLVSAVPAAAADLPVRPFTAHYKVYARGIPAGAGLIALHAVGNHRYQMRSALRATGLVRLFLHDQIHEQASGRIVGRRVEPASYRFERSGGDKREINQYAFNWRQDLVVARHNNHRRTLKLTSRVVDPLSLYLQVMWDLSRGLQVHRYSLIDDAKLKTYHVRRTGQPTLDTALGQLHTVRIERHSPGSSRRTVLWFAPAYDYLPVRISQYKNGSEILRLVIERVNHG